MDELELAGQLSMVRIQMDPRCRAEGLRQDHLEAAPFGSAYVSVSPAEHSPRASSNFNRVHLCGAEEGPRRYAQIADLFRRAGVQKYFVWLSPAPDMERLRGRPAAAGMNAS
jgi:hypothetical protein